jgi:O-succinylbenzoic acid--CoA ligase
VPFRDSSIPSVAGSPLITTAHPYDVDVNELVCLDMPAGPEFVDYLRTAWDAGDAVFPLDQRLPDAAKHDVISSINPTVIITADGNRTPHTGPPVERGDALVVATSGSTGTPKGVVLTHDAVSASALAVHERLDVTASDRWFACLPVAHVGGLSVITRSIVTNTRLHVAERFTPEDYNDAADDGCTLVSLVATALARIDPSRFRTIVLGGSKPPDALAANVMTTYGMTETGSGIVYNGRPLRDVDIKIVDEEIYVRAPMLFRTYRDGTCPIDNDGWFATADLGRIDADGLLHVDGRRGDLIITGGENVWPEQVERVLLADPRIHDVCVAGVPDDEWGHVVIAWIVSDADIHIDDLRDVVKRSLPAPCAPKKVLRIETIPRTALGKPRRAELIASV